MVTYADGECMSACTLVFVAGRQRVLNDESGVIGFHQYGLPGVPSSAWVDGYADDETFAINAGVEREFATRMFTLSNTDMWKPAHEELVASKFVTKLSDGSEFAIDTDDPDKWVEELDSTLRKERVYRAIALYDPSDFADTEATILRIVNSGGALGEVYKALHSMIVKVTNANIGKAPDATVLQLARHLVTTVDHLERVDGDACSAYLFPSRAHETFSLPPTLAQEELDVEAELIENGGAHPVPTPSARETEKWTHEVGVRMWRNDPASARILPEVFSPKVDRRRACRAVAALYREVLSLPSHGAATAVRGLWNGAE
jgi:hypothetical protein